MSGAGACLRESPRPGTTPESARPLTRPRSGTIRACGRVAALAGWTAAIGIGLGLGCLAGPRRDESRHTGARGSRARRAPDATPPPAAHSRFGERRRRLRARLQARLFRAWARGAARIVGARIETRGARPGGPVFLAANHLSYLDIVVLASGLDATFVAKSDVSGWPMVGALCRAVETVFIDRTRKRDLLRVIPLLEDRLRAGETVVVFPEGTTGDGSRVLEFRSPLFEAAVRAGLPAHLATLTYATPPGAPHPSQAVCWWGDMTFGRHLFDLLRLPGFAARVEFVADPVGATHRKPLARAARAGIGRRFVPVTRGEIPWLPVPTSPTPTSVSFARERTC